MREGGGSSKGGRAFVGAGAVTWHGRSETGVSNGNEEKCKIQHFMIKQAKNLKKSQKI